MPPLSGIRIAQAVRRLDEKGYAQANRRTMQAIARSTNAPQGVIQKRLKELDKEAARLEAEGKKLTTDNKVYRQMVKDFRRVMEKNGGRMNHAGPKVAKAGAKNADAIIRLGLPNDPKLKAAFNKEWAAPNPEQLARAFEFMEDDQWSSEVGNFVKGNVQLVDDIALRGLAQGWHPVRTARYLRKTVEETHAKAADALMRTAYLESSRRATAVHQSANARLISRVIRIEALDSRTCMACVGMHGEVIWDIEIDGVGSPVPQIEEHHKGRGTTITEMQGTRRDIETGEDWLARQSPETQRKMFGTKSGYEAYKAGKVKPRDFVQRYDGRVFGPMRRQASVKQAKLNAGKDSSGLE